MAGRLKQPSCQGRDCSDGCGSTPTVTAGACVSRQGDGYLRGFSKYQNENSGDWNTRKALEEWLLGTWAENQWGGDLCEVQSEFCSYRLSLTSSSPWVLNPVTNSLFGSCAAVSGSYTLLGGDPLCEPLAPPDDGCFSYYLGSWINLGGTISAVSDTVASPIDTVCDNEGLGGEAFSRHSVFSHERRNFDTVAAALARGSPTGGSNCRTTAGTIGSTSPAIVTQIAITGTRSVEVPLACANLTNGIDYTITVEIDRYGAGGGSYVNTITVEITFTASGATEDIDYDVPVNTDYDYEFVGATIAVATP